MNFDIIFIKDIFCNAKIGCDANYSIHINFIIFIYNSNQNEIYIHL